MRHKWEVKIYWQAARGVDHPATTLYAVQGEDAALAKAVSILDAPPHPQGLVRAIRAEIKPAYAQRWRPVGNERPARPPAEPVDE